MIRLLADNNADGHLEILVRILLSESWISLWNELDVAVIAFEKLGLDRNANDALLWRTCQREQVVLVTNNRNAEGADSLEVVMRQESQPDSLPVITLASPERIRTDRNYAERTAARLMDFLTYLDEVRGVRRIFIP